MLVDSSVVYVVSGRFESQELGLELVLVVCPGLLLVSPRLLDEARTEQEVNEIEHSVADPASCLASQGCAMVEECSGAARSPLAPADFRGYRTWRSRSPPRWSSARTLFCLLFNHGSDAVAAAEWSPQSVISVAYSPFEVV